MDVLLASMANPNYKNKQRYQQVWAAKSAVSIHLFNYFQFHDLVFESYNEASGTTEDWSSFTGREEGKGRGREGSGIELPAFENSFPTHVSSLLIANKQATAGTATFKRDE